MSKKIIELDGIRQSLNTDTGELRKLYNIEYEEGSIVKIITPEQKEIIKEKEEQKLYKKTSRAELGDFYFIMEENSLGNLSTSGAVRLIYLCTYLNYDNKFMIYRRKEMQKSDIKDLLQLSKSAFHNFWNEVSPTYIIEEGNTFKVNTKEINRGKKRSKKSSYRKIWINQVRKLYQNTPTSKHKHLGYIFNLLPYINIQYNILCWNPDERILDNIKPLTVKEFCDNIGYNFNQVARLITIYQNITFDFKEAEE